MAKKKKFSRITDFAAGLIELHDDLQIKFDLKLKKIGEHITSCAASVIDGVDLAWDKTDRRWLIIRFCVASFLHKNRKKVSRNKHKILSYFAGIVLIAVALVALLNHATGYEYFYNGHFLGYVKNQENVVKILDLVSDELTKEYGSDIQIDKDSNIQFKKAVVIGKDIDDVDTVLKRLTYMSDIQAKAYGIFIDGEKYATCQSKEVIDDVLSKVKDSFTEEKEGTNYEKCQFAEKIYVQEVDTKLAYIMGTNEAVETLIDDTKQGVLNVVTVEKSKYAEKIRYKTIIKETEELYRGESRVVQEGEDGKRVVVARIKRNNGEITEKDILEEDTLKPSVTEIIMKGTKEIPKTAPTGNFIIPVSGYTLSSEFGYRWGRLHEGLDLACPTGTPIHASDGGTVKYASWFSGYGLMIDIDHGNGVVTRYGHCNSINVSVGDKVYQGQIIGEVGNTGNSYGSHCHFEIRKNNTPVDPMTLL